MQRRHAVNGGAGDAAAIRPNPVRARVRCFGIAAAGPPRAGTMNWDRPRARQPAQGGEIQMIVMIVADQHDVDAGKILPSHARFAPAPRTDPGERTRPFRPDRIGQNVGTRLLEQHGGMVDQRDPQLVAFHAGRRFGWLDVGNETRRWLRPAGELPSQDVEKAARLGASGLKKRFPSKCEMEISRAPKRWGERLNHWANLFIYHETRLSTPSRNVLNSAK